MKTTYKYLNYKNYSDITIYNITKNGISEKQWSCRCQKNAV